MSAIKITNFLGKAPVRASELLPDTAAQIAKNCKLVSGNLVPYYDKSIAGSTGYNITVRSLYALRNPDDSLAFLAWPQIVDIATPTVVTNPQEQKYFFTDNQGPPRYSDYANSVNLLLPQPYPLNTFLLGVPIPAPVPTATAGVVPVLTVASIARAANIVTVTVVPPQSFNVGAFVKITGIPDLSGTYSQVTTAVTISITNHGLTTGALIPLDFVSTSGGGPISGSYVIAVTDANTFTVVFPFSGTDSGIVTVSRASFLVDGVRISAITSTTFSFFSPGFDYTTTTVTGATATLASQEGLRFYTYTWVSDAAEEGIPAPPSLSVLAREGQLVQVGNLPTAPPSGGYNVRGIRLYRTLAGTTQSEFYRLQTLQFPTDVAGGSRTNNVSTIGTVDKHMLRVGDRFLLSGIVANPSFDIVGGVVTSVINDKTFTYNQIGSDVPGFFEAPGNGRLFYDVAQNLSRPAVYWTGSTFDDDYDSSLLFTLLPSERYALPPTNLKGLVAINNGILAGFANNAVYFSEPGSPHAWPVEYQVILESPIVALSPLGGSLLVLTEGYPYLITGSKPAVMDSKRIEALYPCVSARSVVAADAGVMYASHDGIIQIRLDRGPLVATKALYDADVWNAEFDPKTIVAAYYDDAYIASHSTGSFSFEPAEGGGTFVDFDEAFTSVWLDSRDDNLYFTKAADSNVYLWDNPAQSPLTLEWKSKTFITSEYVNFGAARVKADYISSTITTRSGSVVVTRTNNIVVARERTITFKMWVDKQLVFTRTITDDQPFRLPTGYRSDTFEFSVESNLRIRSIHVAQTVLGLRKI
jgi:hypothetical protein